MLLCSTFTACSFWKTASPLWGVRHLMGVSYTSSRWSCEPPYTHVYSDIVGYDEAPFPKLGDSRCIQQTWEKMSSNGSSVNMLSSHNDASCNWLLPPLPRQIGWTNNSPASPALQKHTSTSSAPWTVMYSFYSSSRLPYNIPLIQILVFTSF